MAFNYPIDSICITPAHAPYSSYIDESGSLCLNSGTTSGDEFDGYIKTNISFTRVMSKCFNTPVLLTSGV